MQDDSDKLYIISIHSLHTEGDLGMIVNFQSGVFDFNPLPPHGGRPDNWDADQMEMFEFQSTPSTRRETYFTPPLSSELYISIHSLHTEGDSVRIRTGSTGTGHFNPLPPHGGRHWYSYAMSEAEAFQSTPSTRRETAHRCVI